MLLLVLPSFDCINKVVENTSRYAPLSPFPPVPLTGGIGKGGGKSGREGEGNGKGEYGGREGKREFVDPRNGRASEGTGGRGKKRGRRRNRPLLIIPRATPGITSSI